MNGGDSRHQSSAKKKMNKPVKQPKQNEYPEKTKGCEIAAEARREGNSLSDKERENLFKSGMAMIYGGGAKQTTRTRR
jgi:hypothetical protein